MIGLPRGTVKVVPYSYEWPILYKQEEEVLYSLIGQFILDIQHVGSTSLEGLAAKPIIDITIGVRSLDDELLFRSILRDAGYDFRGNAGIEGRIMYAKGSEDLRTHYIHIEAVGSELWKNHIYFRDYLRKNKELVLEYAKLKNELADKLKDEREGYTMAKNKFIDSVLKKAKKEFEGQ